MQNCTITRDIFLSHGLSFVDHLIYLDANSYLAMSDSIIAESGMFTLDQPGDVNDTSRFNVQYVLSNDITTLPSSTSIVAGDPLFIDARDGNFRLQASTLNRLLSVSPAIDFAPIPNGTVLDLDGNAYGQDVPAVVNLFGTRDLGAYEMRPILGRIFADGFGDAISIAY